MQYLENIFNNIVFQTVISGTFVFIIGECVQKFIVIPIIEHKKIIAKIDNKIKFYSNVIFNPPSEMDPIIKPGIYIKTKEILRELSCDVESTYKIIPFKIVFSFLGIISCKDQVASSATDLIWLYNVVGHKKIGIGIETETPNLMLLALEKVKNIRKNLKIGSYE